MPALRFRVTIEQPDRVTTNAIGELELAKNANWIPFKTVRCNITPLTSQELLRSQQAKLDTTHKVNMRYCSGLSTGYRLRWETSTGVHFLHITGIIDVKSLKSNMELFCTATTDGSSGEDVAGNLNYLAMTEGQYLGLSETDYLSLGE